MSIWFTSYWKYIVRPNCSECVWHPKTHVTMCSCQHTNILALPSCLANANSLIFRAHGCRLCDFILHHIFSAGSSGLFATSPEEGDLFSAKPTSQKQPVRAAMVHRRCVCCSYVYIQLATFLLLSSSYPFLSVSPTSFLSSCLLPPLPSLSSLLPFLSSFSLLLLPFLSPFSPSLLPPFLPLSSFSLLLHVYLSYFSSTFLPPPWQPEVAKKPKSSVDLTESTEEKITSPVVSPSASKLKVGEGVGGCERKREIEMEG